MAEAITNEKILSKHNIIKKIFIYYSRGERDDNDLRIIAIFK